MIYTRTGDKGTTGLLDGSRIRKDSIRVESYGTIDELNSFLGFAKNFIDDPAIKEHVHTVQRELFAVAAALADPGSKVFPSKISQEHIERFERWIDEYVAKMDPVPKFIIPGSSTGSGALHVSRTICRRAERLMVGLDQSEPVDPLLMKYINRLSDVLYTFARYLEEQQELVNAGN